MKSIENEEVNVTVEEVKEVVIKEKDIVEYLNSNGIKHSLVGFEYILDAIKGKLTKEYSHGSCKMYEDIAKKFGSSASRVERSMRHAIQSSGMCETEGRVTNSEFICKAVHDLKYR